MSKKRLNILEELKADLIDGATGFTDKYEVVEEFSGNITTKYNLVDGEPLEPLELTELRNGEYVHTIYKKDTNEEIFQDYFLNVEDLLELIEEELDDLRQKEEENEFSKGLRKSVEVELGRIFTEYIVPDNIVEEIIEDVKETSDYHLGIYSSSDVTIAVQRVLLNHLDFEVN